MKKLLLVGLIGVAILFSCEEEEEICWQCDVISTMELTNQAYSQDKVIVEKIEVFEVCGKDNMEIAIDARETVNNIEDMEIEGTVYAWSGTETIECDCDIIK